MDNNWSACKKILCIRPDNIGDLLMSAPAISALKNTFNAKITLLTSSMAKGIVPHLPCIDDYMIYDVPWVKSTASDTFSEYCALVNEIKKRNFDAAVIFTVFSQNPLPTAMIAYHAGIPRRLGYCRENPYQLLTEWIPDEEPYTFITHQVKRDLRLVETVGAKSSDDRIHLNLAKAADQVDSFLKAHQLDTSPFVVFHPGVSEDKRKYPTAEWIQLGRKITTALKQAVVVTGTAREADLAGEISASIGTRAFSAAGIFDIGEFITLLKHASLIVSVNTATIHLASAIQKPVVVLYALTNPQHTPWMATGEVIPFPVSPELRSRNEVLKYVHDRYFQHDILTPGAEEVFHKVRNVIEGRTSKFIPELVHIESTDDVTVTEAHHI